MKCSRIGTVQSKKKALDRMSIYALKGDVTKSHVQKEISKFTMPRSSSFHKKRELLTLLLEEVTKIFIHPQAQMKKITTSVSVFDKKIENI